MLIKAFSNTYLSNYKIEIKKVIDSIYDYMYYYPYLYNVKFINEYMFLKIISNSKQLYHKIEIPKRNGEKRIIYEPKEELKIIQKYLLHDIFYKELEKFDFKSSVTGYLKNTSIKKNAKEHLNKKFIIKIDIKDFFPSISRYMIFKTLQYRLNLSYEKAYIYSKIMTYDDFLPQGACTSPFIANACVWKLDNRLIGLMNKLNGSYTRFADDMTFSFNKKINFDKFINQVYEVIYDEGYIPNYTKTKVFKNTIKQEVTGIVVNGKDLSVSKNRRDDLRFILNIWKKYDKLSATQKYKEIFNEKCNEYNFEEKIKGQINFIKMVNENQGEKLEEIFNENIKGIN